MKKTLLAYMALFTIAGVALIWYNTNAWTALGFALFQWSQNIAVMYKKGN